MAKRYSLLNISTVVLLVFIKDCKGDIQSYTNFGNGWISSGYHASFESDSEPQIDFNQMDLSDFKSPLNPFSSSEQSGFSSNSYSSSSLKSSRFPAEDIINSMFNSDISAPRSNVHISSSSSSWPWNQDFSSVSFDSSQETSGRYSQSNVDKMKYYISSTEDKLGFNDGNSNMKISEISSNKQMLDPLKEFKFHGFETNSPSFTSTYRITSKLNSPATPEILPKSRETSLRIPSSSTSAPSPRVLPSSNSASKPQHIGRKRYRPRYNKKLTTVHPKFEKESLQNSSVNNKYPLKYFDSSDSNLNSKMSSVKKNSKANHNFQPAIKEYNSSLLSLGQTYDHNKYSLSSELVISPKNKNNSLSSDSLISSKNENPEPRNQFQNRSDSSRNASTKPKPLYPTISSSNQTMSLNHSDNSNNTNYQQNRTHGKLKDNFYTFSDNVYVKEYQTSDSRYKDLLVGLTRYNMARSRRHYNNHFYNDEFYRNRVSFQVNHSAIVIATCTLNLKEKDQVILLKIPCDIVSTFTDGSHRIEASNITKTTTCVTSTTILNDEKSELKEKSDTNHTEVPTVTETENLVKKTTTVSTINTIGLTHNLTDLKKISSKPKTPAKFFKSIITNTTLKIATIPKLSVDDITMNSTIKSNNTVLSSKLGNNYVQDVKITSFEHQDLKLVTVITCTTEVTDPLSIKGAPVNTSNIECNVEIHTQETFLRNYVSCRTLLRYAKLYKP